MFLPPPSFRIFFAALAFSLTSAQAADLTVSTSFPGGSATVESIDQSTRTIHFMPGGEPAHGWPCWWYLRINNSEAGEKVILDLAGSDRPARNNGKDTGKPLASSWAMPGRAAVSTDGKTWRHTEPGHRDGARMRYEVVSEGGSLYVAWGPPFTTREAETLIASTVSSIPGAERFELCRSRGDRPVPALRIAASTDPKPFAIWIDARQHAWESGSSWVASGLVDWVSSNDESAVWLRQHAEIVVIPIMDVDNVETGNGGKEADPRDHNRDWSDTPLYPEVIAAQARLRALAAEERLDFFMNLHNPCATDPQPFFFCGPIEFLSPLGQRNRAAFLARAREQITQPLALDPKTRETGPSYHPLWRQISCQWVTDHGNTQTVAACLETSWNTPSSTVDGYRTVGRQLAQSIAKYFREDHPRTPPTP